MTDLEAMKKAIELGQKGRLLAPPNPWVGCVITAKGKIIGEGFTHVVGEAHAEVRALHSAGDLARGSTVYVTLEPCSHYGRTPPCAEALIRAQVQRVVVGIQDPDTKVSGNGIAALRKAGIEVEVGLYADLISDCLAPYLHHRKTALPYCVLKAAISIDGRTAAADGSSQWITGCEARDDVHRLRAESQAILIGSGTALSDKPRLTVRNIIPLPPKPPLRVVLDSRGRIPAEGPLFDLTLAPTLIMTTDQADSFRIREWEAKGVEVVIMPKKKEGSRIDLSAALHLLGKRGILQLLVEGGAGLCQAFLEEKLTQNLRLYVGPRILGSTGLPVFGNWNIQTLAHAPSLHLLHCQPCGDSVCLSYGFVNQDKEENF